MLSYVGKLDTQTNNSEQPAIDTAPQTSGTKYHSMVVTKELHTTCAQDHTSERAIVLRVAGGLRTTSLHAPPLLNASIGPSVMLKFETCIWTNDLATFKHGANDGRMATTTIANSSNLLPATSHVTRLVALLLC